ncbi:hypothetical protein AAB992_26860 [Burkholderia contaminans]|nr:hypothetical protein [Burkholderia contaminans]
MKRTLLARQEAEAVVTTAALGCPPAFAGEKTALSCFTPKPHI